MKVVTPGFQVRAAETSENLKRTDRISRKVHDRFGGIKGVPSNQ